MRRRNFRKGVLQTIKRTTTDLANNLSLMCKSQAKLEKHKEDSCERGDGAGQENHCERPKDSHDEGKGDDSGSHDTVCNGLRRR